MFAPIHNDWDSYEELHTTAEHLEVIRELLKSRSHRKARAAAILLDHVADILMYRVCSDDFEKQAMMELVMPPELPAPKRAEILFHFEKKVAYLSQTKKLISAADAAVLLVGHRIRNLAYHRDYHNPNAIAVVGRILYKTVCGMLPILKQRGSSSYSSPKEWNWTKRYGITATHANYHEVLTHLSTVLGQLVTIDLSSAIRVLQADLSVRSKRIRSSLDNWFSFKQDEDLDAILKHYEFQHRQQKKIEEFWQPLKEARYLVHELHKDVPPEQWRELSVSPERRYEIRRTMITAERQFKTLRRRAFREFRQTITARHLRVLERKTSLLANSPSLSRLLCNYEFLDRELSVVKSYVSRAESDVEFAVDRARGK